MTTDGWKDEAKRYAGNADYWRDRAEKAEAELAAANTVAVPVDQLKHWAEYWNGSANEKAISDALEFILGEVDDLLTAAAKEGGNSIASCR